jgi:hypothetical protein
VLDTRTDIAKTDTARFWPEGAGHPVRNRRSDHGYTCFRGDRYFTVGHEWYVTLREGKDLGPYLNRDDAELALAMHVAKCCLAAPGGIAEMFAGAEDDTGEFEILVSEMVDGLEQRQLRGENCAYVWIKQRLDAIYMKPAQETYPLVRLRALNFLFGELDK